MKFLKSLAVAAVAALTSGGVQAAPMVFTDETAFDLAFSSIYTLDDFDTAPTSSLNPLNRTGYNINFSTVSGTGTAFFVVELADPNRSNGTTAVRTNTGLDTITALTFNFDTPIDVFGIDLWDIGTTIPPSFTNVSLLSGNTLIADIASNSTDQSPGQVSFIGFKDDMQTYSSLTIQVETVRNGSTLSGRNDLIYYDDLRFGKLPPPEVIPLPAGVWLSLSGLFALGFMGWRRRS